MKNILKVIRVGVFALAGILAFAFTQPVNIQEGYGAERDEGNNIVAWHPVSELSPSDYDCDLTAVGCIYEEDNEMSDVLEPGKFVLTNP